LADELEVLVTEAVELRFGARSFPEDVQIHPDLVQLILLDARKRLDRMEELLVTAIRVRGRARGAASARQNEVDDEWARAIDRSRKDARRTSGNDYSGAKERYAEADLAVLELRIKQRQAQAFADQAQVAYDVVRVCHRGLDTLRGDCVAYLRSLQFESSLER